MMTAVAVTPSKDLLSGEQAAPMLIAESRGWILAGPTILRSELIDNRTIQG
jgi:hypothetical protein